MCLNRFGRVSSLKWWQGHFPGLQSGLQRGGATLSGDSTGASTSSTAASTTSTDTSDKACCDWPTGAWRSNHPVMCQSQANDKTCARSGVSNVMRHRLVISRFRHGSLRKGGLQLTPTIPASPTVPIIPIPAILIPHHCVATRLQVLRVPLQPLPGAASFWCCAMASAATRAKGTSWKNWRCMATSKQRIDADLVLWSSEVPEVCRCCR